MHRYLLLALMLLGQRMVYAQNGAAGRDTLEKIVVTAGRLPSLLTETPAAVSRLDSAAINESRAVRLDQLLNKVNGVFMVNLGNEQHSMSIRQPQSYRSLFLYLEDGIPIRPAGVFNHNALIEMNMAALSQIEIIKGPSSAFYGSEAIGAALNFMSGDAPPLPEAYVSAQADNLGYRRLDFKSGSSHGRSGWQLNGYYALRRNGLQEHSDFDKLALSIRHDHRFSPSATLTSGATLVNYKADMTGSLDSLRFYSKTYPSPHTFTYREVKAFRLRSTLEKKWRASGESSFTLFFRDNLIGQNPSYRVRNDRGNPLRASGEINEQSFRSYGGIIQHNKESGFWNSRLAAGASADFSPVHYLANYIQISRDEKGNYTGFLRSDSLLSDYRVDMLNLAGYFQWEARPLEPLTLTAALRYDYFMYDYRNALPPNAFSGAPDSRDHFRNFSPKLGFTYRFSRRLGGYASFSTGFVPPQITELYRGVSVPVLKPSVYYNYEAGAWLAFPRGSAELSLYRLEGVNEIISVLMDDGSTENRNAGRTTHQGIEYQLRYELSPRLKFRTGGTLARHTYLRYAEGEARYDGNEMDAAPRWLGNSELSVYPFGGGKLHLSLEWQHMGSYYMDPENSEKYKGFDVLNFRAGGRIRQFEAWVGVLNIGNTLYATNSAKSAFGKQYSPGEPRSFSMGLAYRFIKHDHEKNTGL